MTNKLNLVWDMETGDPDDFMTMLWLADHPQINLKAVTVTPGSKSQVGVVRWGLDQLELDIPIGAYDIDREKTSVSGWHYSTFGVIPPSDNARPGWEVLAENLDAETTLLTGAPLKNIKVLLRDHDEGVTIGRWVAQGGFAGDPVVPEEHRLPQFAGKVTCPTYNFNGDPKGAILALAHPAIKERRCVSKNVCHGVFYNSDFHAEVEKVKDSRKSLGMIYDAMSGYLRKRKEGKKFHDPLAACAALDPSIVTWAEVEVYRAKGEWGSVPSKDTNTWITTAVDQEAFRRTFLGL